MFARPQLAGNLHVVLDGQSKDRTGCSVWEKEGADSSWPFREPCCTQMHCPLSLVGGARYRSIDGLINNAGGVLRGGVSRQKGRWTAGSVRLPSHCLFPGCGEAFRPGGSSIINRKLRWGRLFLLLTVNEVVCKWPVCVCVCACVCMCVRPRSDVAP